MKKILSVFLAFAMLFSSGIVNVFFAADVRYYMSEEEQDIFIKGTYKREIKTVPAGADTSFASWLSSDESVATVDGDGTVRARKKGTAVIMAEIGSETFSYRVRVVNPFLSNRQKNIYMGRQYTLSVNGGSGKIKWTTSNQNVATVKNGVVTAKKPGKATITAIRNGVSMQCKVTVLKPALNKTALNLQVSQKARLKVYGGTEKAKWVSSNPSVVYVNANGAVKGRKTGKATITATVNGYKMSCKVSVYVLTLSRSSLTLEEGGSQRLAVTGGSGKVTWKSSNPKIAAVSQKGVVYGKKTGTATITAIKNGFNLNCKVTVRVTNLEPPKGKENIVEAYCDAVNKAKNTKNFKLSVVNDPSFVITKSTDTQTKVIYTILLGSFFSQNEKNYVIKNGKIDEKKNATAVIPPLLQACELDPAGVESASAKKNGSGYTIQMKLVKEKAHFSGTGSNTCVYNKAVSMPINLSVLQIADDDDFSKITVTYLGTTVKAEIDNRGRLTRLDVYAPQTFRVDTNFSANINDKDIFIFTY